MNKPPMVFLLAAFIPVILSSAITWAGSTEPLIMIRLDSYPGNTHHHSVSEFQLKSKPEGFYCSTKSIPEHLIKPKGLRSIAAPFKGQKISAECEHVLSWGKARTCYQRGTNWVIDDVLRWCGQL